MLQMVGLAKISPHNTSDTVCVTIPWLKEKTVLRAYYVITDAQPTFGVPAMVRDFGGLRQFSGSRNPQPWALWLQWLCRVRRT